ncbi:bifunctional 4-hydroxy-2-oxoglutarate aldolase/2-dehydro-3-deoxy-phosphogluconate aldolase [Jatrophihabitans telluris]|uniref:Bifunctional 4-hydroxy-2-oxoglutarate aldolase/2-dehydro-3-deoxy-phosphogluconate aldolase n=1 Tax=Jatrophihabitans telluris TaxID=2038343 RepID=A0ABY4R3P0_9ACTN|nr:bifunctional 4-hydroxy-2-oxoglutarate aldolase/2-dehydro-3-deoxy-phosphogluconate aldolase [Jatrophihabitans telluris]UQX89619.1 bifunctional 4-hydroxy-2-oxoglutarate aldolase/2-dehydro-3-deoxy-phosphogluconate aldolase [Jatrophihabitans telluris]
MSTVTERVASVSPLDLAPVIPVVVISDPDKAVPLARALLAGGVRVIELTMRTPAALESARLIAAEVPEMVLGVGTVISTEQAEQAVGAGARFLVSPGATERLLDGLIGTGVPFLAGTASATDVVRLLERGITEAKLFPAEVVGGIAMLKALHGPFAQVRFCPTGGISPATAPSYLALPNVGCVGGSWIAPPALQEAGDWAGITALARATTSLV